MHAAPQVYVAQDLPPGWVVAAADSASGGSSSRAREVNVPARRQRSDRAKAADIAERFGTQLLAVEESCRERAPPAEQVAALKAASAALQDFLAVSATKFEIPVLSVAPGAPALL